MRLPTAVEIVEVGPRDGLQSEAAHVPTAGKVVLLEALTAAGIKRLEATSFVSPSAIPQLADAEEMLAALPREAGVVYGGLIPNERGYERAARAGVDEVVLVGAATESYCRANLRRSVDEILDGFAPIVARGRADDIHVRANISTVFGDPFEGRPEIDQVLRVVSRVVEAGIDDLTLSDTIGVADPRQVGDVFGLVAERHPGVRLAAHFHDTRGLALANVLAALDAGVETFDASVGGLGGSPNAPGAGGNLATEDAVYMLGQMGIETGIEIDALMDAAELMERLVDHGLPARIDRSLLVQTASSR